MQKHFIWIIVLFITSPIFSQTDIYDINQAHPKSTELMFQYPPVSIRERLQLPIPNIDYLKEIEHIKVDNWIPLEFFTKMTAEDSGLVISYTTHVADINHEKEIIIKLGYWSMTTSKHINMVGRHYDYEVVEEEPEVKAKRKETEQVEENNAGGALKLMGAFSMLQNMGDGDLKTKNERRARIVFATPGMIKPENWDELSEKEKKSRLDQVEEIALKS